MEIVLVHLLFNQIFFKMAQIGALTKRERKLDAQIRKEEQRLAKKREIDKKKKSIETKAKRLSSLRKNK